MFINVYYRTILNPPYRNKGMICNLFATSKINSKYNYFSGAQINIHNIQIPFKTLCFYCGSVCIWFLNQRQILLSLVQLHVYFLTDVTLLFFFMPASAANYTVN